MLHTSKATIYAKTATTKEDGHMDHPLFIYKGGEFTIFLFLRRF
jgi:hypothetical protein